MSFKATNITEQKPFPHGTNLPFSKAYCSNTVYSHSIILIALPHKQNPLKHTRTQGKLTFHSEIRHYNIGLVQTALYYT
jgi:hypothetical protein